jgi:hypothetical protein
VRKWIVIGLALLVIGGVSSYVLWPLRKGTLEYHKKQCIEEFYETGLLGRINEHGPRLFRGAYLTRRQARLNFHRQALLDLGFLQKRVFVLSNVAPDHSMFWLLSPMSDPAFGGARTIIGNSVVIIAPSDEMPVLEDAVRKFDIPEK